jgi:hypothetical protein
MAARKISSKDQNKVPAIIFSRFWQWPRLLAYLGNNVVTLLGAALTTSAGVTMVLFWAFELLLGHGASTYAGIIMFLILPGIFVTGLVLIPLGALWRRFRERRAGATIPVVPHLKWSEPKVRRALTVIGAATLLNITIMGTATYRGIEYMDSVQFCGTACHTVMEPEYTAYLDSPHSRVACVSCHIGPGAPWFVRTKLSGTRQIFAVWFKTYSRPIPSPVKHLRPARDTCEQCHWPAMFHGDKFLVRTKYSDDEANTPLKTVLVLKVGGRTFKGSVGIHGRHMNGDDRIEYLAADEKRERIPHVVYREESGKKIDFLTSADKANVAANGGEWRKMDCIDCHNRPTHTFEAPDRAVDRAMDEGRISVELPFVKKQAMQLLQKNYESHEDARVKITQAIKQYYRATYPQIFRDKQKVIEGAAEQLGAIYSKNVFPQMNVTWGTYPNHIGHQNGGGCFRCHDDNHTSADGRSITQDCEACHEVLAMEERNPKILKEMGVK